MSDDNMSLDNSTTPQSLATIVRRFHRLGRRVSRIGRADQWLNASAYDTPAAFEGLEDFSHIWVSWQFHHNYRDKNNQQANNGFRPQVRPPRLGGNQKIGVFASRSMYRPSELGLSVVKLERIEIVQGRVLLIIKGADMIDGTPIIDIKPYVAYSDVLLDAKSGFAPIAPTLLDVVITEAAYEQFMLLASVAEPAEVSNNDASHSSMGVYRKVPVASMVEHIQSQLLIRYWCYQSANAQDPSALPQREKPHLSCAISLLMSWLIYLQLQITAVVAI